MAISATMVWEVRSTASGNAVNNGGGGGFKPGASGTDWSQQNDCQYHLTGATSAAANAIILHASAAADMVGNIAHLISGTNATVGWYEIISVSPGVSITVDRTCCSAALALGVVNIGGCISLNSATANQTDTLWAAALVAGNTVHVKGALTLAATFTVTDGVSGTPITFNGYNATRSDNPAGANRPSIDCATFAVTTGLVNIWKNIIFTGTAASMITHSGQASLLNCKATNTSSTASRSTIVVSAANSVIQDCELISYRGNAISATSNVNVYGCYIHDSDTGMTLNTNAACIIKNNIIESCVTQAILTANTGTAINLIEGNTFYGSEAKTGIGLTINAALTGFRLLNNIIYGFVTGVTDGNAAGITYADYNCFNNNTTARTNLSTGAHDISTTPGFTNVRQVTGTAGSISSATLTSAASDFSNVVDNQDFCYIISGTGATAGQYLITGHTATTLTLHVAPGGSGTNIAFQVTTGRNFSPSTNVTQDGFPGIFPASLTTSFVDIGAAQRDFNTELHLTKHLGARHMG